MNKLYTIVAALTIAGTATAQLPASAVLKEAKTFNPLSASAFNRPVQDQASWLDNGQRAVFYSEDFSGTNGLPAGWTTVDDLTPTGQTPVNFAWANTPGAVTPAAAGQPLILTFLAPGASNGFLWANSDRGLTAAPSTNHLTRLTTAPIDCSGQSSVLLTMKSTIGVFDLDADTAVKVRVSTDGVNWTNFAPFPCLKAGGINPPCERFSYNPQNVAVNITSVAANQSTVYLQFQWRGGWEYYWAIDDLELSSLPDHELVMEYGYTVQFSDGYEYGRVPQSLMPATLIAGASVINFGGVDQTNVEVIATIEDEGGASVATATTNIPTLASGDTAATEELIALPNPMPLGRYTVTFTLNSDDIGLDANENNNTAIRYFAVTQDLYSIDAIDVVPDSIQTLSALGTASFLDNTQDVRFLNYYEVPVQETFYGVEVYLDAARTNPGSYFIAAIYDTTDVQVGSSLSSPLVESEIRVITAADVSNGIVTVHFLDAITLPANAYYVGVRLYQEDGNDIYILDDTSVPQPWSATMLWTPVDDNNQFLYSNGNAMAIRLSSDPSVGVQESTNLEGVTMYPSPTAGPVEIRLESPGKMNVEVYNVLGELVKTASFSGTATTLDLTGHSAGIYTIRVSDGAHYNVQRITLK